MQSFILGLLQGLTEFLPVSSSGHLILACLAMNVEPSLSFELALHVATLLAVIVYYRKTLRHLLLRPFNVKNLYLICATAITAVLALALRDFADVMQNGELLPLFFTATAGILIAGSCFKPKKSNGILSCVFVGAAQGIAVIPGLSRSGLTVAAGMMSGKNKEEATENSFLLSIPVVAGSALIEITSHPIKNVQPLPLTIGLVTAFIGGLLALKLFDFVNKKASPAIFSAYLIVLSATLLIIKFCA